MPDYHIIISLFKPAKQSDNAFIPSTLFDPLPNHPYLIATSAHNEPTPQEASLLSTSKAPRNFKDYRVGPVGVNWVEFEPESQEGTSKESAMKRSASAFRAASGKFIPTNAIRSGATNLSQGIVHILRESRGAAWKETDSPPRLLERFSHNDGTVLAILAVPSYIGPSDFLSWTSPAADGIQHLRIVHDNAPNRSMAVIKFRSKRHADLFLETYNGRQFTPIEPETCHVVRVLSVQINTLDAESPIPYFTDQISTMSELPTCPVCLERMDTALTGLVTVACSHTFHCACLSKWGDVRCPVCRYSQTSLITHSPSATRRPDPNARCSDCGTDANLWICLICGNIGCGRYARAHAHAHHESSAHLYALELATQRVWDYAGDGYVHRLIHNRADGKLVELPSLPGSSHVLNGSGGNRDSTLGPGPDDMRAAEKVEAVGLEYANLITSQLDSQRAYFEEQAAELRAAVDTAQTELARVKAAADERAKEDELAKAELAERAAESELARVNAQRRADKMQEIARKFEKDLKAERAVSEGLMARINKLQEAEVEGAKERASLQERLKDVEDQLRDVMFFLEAKATIEQQGDQSELAGGSVIVPAPPTPPSTKANGKKKKGGK
ncbi:BRCA1-associated protein [Ceratobasidium sp. AG-Ba]|nr:BRCA1-associated protein [Ceratobasidium sp. AG-Ba]